MTLSSSEISTPAVEATPLSEYERTLHRLHLNLLKTWIRENADFIKAQRIAGRKCKAEGDGPGAAALFATARERGVQVRAQLLLYGFLRGKTWAQMEPNHPEGVPFLYYLLRHNWTLLEKAARLPQADVHAVYPPLLAQYVPEVKR